MTRLINKFAAQFGKARPTQRSRPLHAPMPHDVALAAIGVTAPEFL
ncbi:hypothetical protein HKD42_09995 [Altererythrobacter sp. RZ02]|uniref:Uncharacterized protein n=1 Tax=Pontixanthobacter rizhaonensis TaxID=2730337 RepID=A0A848QFI2_9SPHN|nr:hypothetical protein [Pontixanthobacter rizhaonensis]NMW32391.1 hypothetical protein [Pontixanthobacter rizhaonensis]